VSWQTSAAPRWRYAAHGRVAPRTLRRVHRFQRLECEWQTRHMAPQEIDAYLASLDEPKRSTLEDLRRLILDVVPDAEQCISYGMPAFKVNGKTVAGFAAFKGHLSYLPHSGSVLPELADDLAGYTSTKGSLHFPVDKPLPSALVSKLVRIRMRELDRS
jgi:uncharacterized protein YdhG (YjbR/CyaY superfamily)